MHTRCVLIQRTGVAGAMYLKEREFSIRAEHWVRVGNRWESRARVMKSWRALTALLKSRYAILHIGRAPSEFHAEAG